MKSILLLSMMFVTVKMMPPVDVDVDERNIIFPVLTGPKCAKDGRWGCHKGLCWAQCWGAKTTTFGLGPEEWCYTTKGSSLDFSYIACASINECDPCWKCGGWCTV